MKFGPCFIDVWSWFGFVVFRPCFLDIRLCSYLVSHRPCSVEFGLCSHLVNLGLCLVLWILEPALWTSVFALALWNCRLCSHGYKTLSLELCFHGLWGIALREIGAWLNQQTMKNFRGCQVVLGNCLIHVQLCKKHYISTCYLLHDLGQNTWCLNHYTKLFLS